MAGKSRNRLSFHSRVLLSVLVLCWILVGIFMLFLYHREKEFKSELLETELQMYNAHILDDMRLGKDINDIVARIQSPADELRISLIDKNGTVIYDNNIKTPFPTTNHNTRPEIIAARVHGTGYTVGRHSESDNQDYFYSARLGDDGLVIRSAAPYTHSLRAMLKADCSLIWIMAIMTSVTSFIGFIVTRKISLSIQRLNRFAEKAEKGEQIFNDEAFPDDELGSIASNIVKLYVQRDQQHREVIRQEQDKIRLKKQLTNNINHELKTPVASILICLDLLRDHPELSDEKKREFNNRIYANAQRLNALLNDVSTITRMDEGTDLIEKCPIDVSSIVNSIVAEKRLITDVTINVNVSPLTINGNRTLLESIFSNLIDNALAYSGCTEINIASDQKGNFIVSDNGCGIAEEHLPHIFERFYRIDKGRSRSAGGTGLGLAIVRNAVSIHGGSIKAVSNNGLTFTFQLKNS